MTGIKGTGMAALAEVLHHRGAAITGSDVADTFYTDTILRKLGISPFVGFSADHVGMDVELLVYSAAYDEDNPERAEALRRGIPQYSYNELLGILSRDVRSLAISGVHGKTTTTAMIGMMVDRWELPATVVVGSAVSGFGGTATLIHGEELFIAETCEYRRHFLHFHPDVVVITSVEADHLDYFRDAADVMDAFTELTLRLPTGGAVVYCADDEGASIVAERAGKERRDIRFIPYGFTAAGEGEISDYRVVPGKQIFRMAGLDRALHRDEGIRWEIGVPGRHMVLDAAAAITALHVLEPTRDDTAVTRWREALADFSGTRRRSEIVADTAGVLILDDYAHHPTAIDTTLRGFREFWPDRRIIVDFMSHTYSRTAALLDRFARAFGSADVVFLNDIYASAREHNHGGITGESLARAVADHHGDVRYIPSFTEAAEEIGKELRRGDIFVTMGAGDNFRIGTMVAEILSGRGADE